MPAHVSGLGMSVKNVAVPRSGTKSNGKDGQSNAEAVKSIGSTRTRTTAGLPATTILFDEETGIARAVLNARHLTALRTAAGSLLASRLVLCKSGADAPLTTVAFFGVGLQIQFHAKLLFEGFPSIERCYIINRSLNSRATGLVEGLAKAYPSKHFELITGTEYCKSTGTETLSPRCSSLNADVLCFATSATSPLIASSSIKPGAHLILIGSYTPDMHEVPTEVIKRASKVVVDSREHAMREAGELIDARLENGDVLELGELINEDGEPVEEMIQAAQKGDITIFKSVGLAVQDVMIARLLCTLAEDKDIGTVINEFD